MAREEEIVSEEIEELEPLVREGPRIPSPEASADPRDTVTVPEHRPTLFDPWSISAVIVAVLMAMVVIKMSSPTVLKPKVWAVDELAKYDGTNRRLPLLLSILGSVFDVSQGQSHYGPGGGYHHFTGRDASRAFVSGNFTEDGLIDSLEGLTPLEVKSIYDWKIFFEKKYLYVGTLVGTFYDEFGTPTKALIRAERQVALGEKIIQEQKEDEKRFPSCNSWWNARQGGEVWCTTGYPRIVDKISEGTYKGTTGSRCACYEEMFLHREGLRVYEGCAATAQRCQSSPPQV